MSICFTPDVPNLAPSSCDPHKNNRIPVNVTNPQSLPYRRVLQTHPGTTSTATSVLGGVDSSHINEGGGTHEGEGSTGGSNSSDSSSGGVDSIQPTDRPHHAAVHFADESPPSSTDSERAHPLTVPEALPPLHLDACNAEGGNPAGKSPLVAATLEGVSLPAVGDSHPGTHPGVESRGIAEGGSEPWLDGEAEMRSQGSGDGLESEIGFRDVSRAHRVIDVLPGGDDVESTSSSESEDGSAQFAERQQIAAQVCPSSFPTPTLEH